MTTRRLKNVGASVRDRLLRRSRESGEDFQFLLERYAAERFLYRLGESAHRHRLILKGAMLFALWRGSLYRPTRDLDFTGRGSSDAEDVLAVLRDVCAVPVEDDGLVLDAGTLTAKPIRDDAEYNGLRIHLQAELSGARIRMQIDIGFGNAIVPPATEADYPTLLDDQPSPRILAYPQEAVVAEKLHAMVDLGERNSRYKDFYDLHGLAKQFRFDGRRLAQAISATFQRRKTVIEAAVPAALTPRFYADDSRAEQWRAYLGNKARSGTPAHFGDAGELIQQFLLPPWRGLADGSEFSGVWKPLGPWSSEKPIEELLAHVQNATDTERPRRYKPYSAYRDSGVERLGDIPAHWDMKRIREAVSRRVTDGAHISPDTSSPDFPFVSTVDIQEGIIDFEGCLRTSTSSFAYMKRTGCTPHSGDVLFSKDGTVGTTAVVIDDREFAVASSLVIISPDQKQMDPNWLNYWLKSDFINNGLDRLLSGAALRRISVAKVGRLPLLLPPEKNEQRKIASFLDRERGKIDALVTKKEQLIRLLQERRNSLITQAFSKGLDPNVPMKDSSVEWLGKIPAHWEVTRLKRVVPQITVGIVVTPSKYYVNDGVPCLRSLNIAQGRMSLSNLVFISESANELHHKSQIFHDDLVVVRTGRAGAAVVVPAELDGANCIDLLIIRRSPLMDSRFLYYFMNSQATSKQVEAHAVGAIQGHYNTSTLANLFVPKVPLGEQKKIAAYLTEETARTDALIDNVRKAIAHLKERRTALITAAVTGRIDVREEVA